MLSYEGYLKKQSQKYWKHKNNIMKRHEQNRRSKYKQNKQCSITKVFIQHSTRKASFNWDHSRSEFSGASCSAENPFPDLQEALAQKARAHGATLPFASLRLRWLCVACCRKAPVQLPILAPLIIPHQSHWTPLVSMCRWLSSDSQGWVLCRRSLSWVPRGRTGT